MEARDKETLTIYKELLFDREMEVRLGAIKALKHLAASLDVGTISALIGFAMDALPSISGHKSLHFAFELHLTLLRVTPLQYAMMFALLPKWISEEVSQRLFVASIWMHCVNVRIETADECLFIDEKQVTLSSSREELNTFGAALELIETEFVSIVSSYSTDLGADLQTLREPVKVGTITSRYASLGRVVS